MASLSDRLGQVIQTSKPQTKGLAGEIRAFAGDTSDWEVKDGVRQENGFAVCDGSTLDNSSGEYADFLDRTGSLTLPNGPYRTREVDLNYNLSSLDSGSFTSRFMKGYFYTDDKGNWRLNFTGAFTLDVSDIFFYLRIQNIVGKDFGAGNDDRQYFAVDCPFGGSNDQASGYARGGDNFFRISGVSNQTEYNVAGDILLDSKPTIANFDDYLEATPVAALYDNVGNVISTGNFQANGDATVNGDLTVGGEARLSSGQVDGDLQVNGEITGSAADQIAEGNRNYIYNGAFEINQRGNVTGVFSSQYVADRWFLNTSGANIDAGVFEDGTNDEFSNFLRITANTADDNWGWFQKIESVKTLAGKKVTLSFEARSEDQSVSSIRIENDQIFGTGGTPSGSVTLPETDIDLTSEFVSYSFTFEVPSLDGKTIGTDNNDFLSIGFIQKANQTGQFDIRRVKLEQGTQATKFTRAGVTYAGELALCQRYCYVIKTDFTHTVGFGDKITLNTYMGTFPVPVPMRTVPSISFEGGVSIVYAGSTTTKLETTPPVANTIDGAIVHIQRNVGLELGRPMVITMYGVGGKAIFDAEL